MVSTRSTDIYRRAPRALQVQAAEQLLVYAPGLAEPVALNESAGSVWQLIDGLRSLQEVSDTLAARFGCPATALLSDVRDVAGRLAEIGLVQPCAAEEPPPDRNVDWRRVAEPQADQYDTEVVLDFAAARLAATPGATPQDWSATPRFVDDRVPVGHCYRGLHEQTIGPGFDDAPLDHPHIAAAEPYLALWPTAQEQFARLMTCVHPLIGRKWPCDDSAFLTGSSSHGVEDADMFGTMYSSINCPLMFADNCVHEMAHQKLFALGVLKESSAALITNDPCEMYDSPVITNRKRPMTAVVHGVYAFCYVTQLNIKVLPAFAGGERRCRMEERLVRNLDRLAQGLPEIQQNVRTDAAGAHFFAGLYDWIARMLADGGQLLSGRSLES